jgi:hypothetical protein
MKAVSDGLRLLDGVDDVKVDLQANLCTVTPARDRMPALDGFAPAVRATGYRPGRMWLRARGATSPGDGQRWFTIEGTRVRLRVDGTVPAAGALTGEVTSVQPDIVVVSGAPPR